MSAPAAMKTRRANVVVASTRSEPEKYTPYRPGVIATYTAHPAASAIAPSVIQRSTRPRPGRSASSSITPTPASAITISGEKASTSLKRSPPDHRGERPGDGVHDVEVRRREHADEQRDRCERYDGHELGPRHRLGACLLYTSDAADEEDSVDLGGR